MSAVTSQPGLTPVILPVRTIEPPATISPEARAVPHAGFGFGTLPENDEISEEIRRFIARHG